MRAVTRLGSDAFLIPGAAAVILLLLYYGRRRSAWIFLIVMLGAELLNQVLKLFFRRNRPEAFFNYPLPSSYSFPSGHSLMSACFFGALAAVLAPLLRSRVAQAALWASAVLLVAVIGLSRVYLGVHFPSDVIGGFAAGIAWTAGVRAVLEMRSGTPPRNRL
jgi:undecaprenyl-diphosphatase